MMSQYFRLSSELSGAIVLRNMKSITDIEGVTTKIIASLCFQLVATKAKILVPSVQRNYRK